MFFISYDIIEMVISVIENNMNIIIGKQPILLSAPHSVLHIRENSIRPRETKTGVIVDKIAKKCNVMGYLDYNEHLFPIFNNGEYFDTVNPYIPYIYQP